MEKKEKERKPQDKPINIGIFVTGGAKEHEMLVLRQETKAV